MNRTGIINSLIEKFDYKSYLEIGVRSGANFKGVRCNRKVGVDISSESAATVVMSSDNFFSSNKEKFDLVFVDGDHDGEQVFTDVMNALDILSDGGTIVMHDCNPANEWLQRPASEFVQGEACNGTVWKAFAKLRKRGDLRMAVVDTDNGIGIVRRGKQVPLEFGEMSYDEFDKKRNEVLCLIEEKDIGRWLNERFGLDILVVKYFDNQRDEELWKRTMRGLRGESVLIWDNNSKNIGLVKARKTLLKKSDAKYICFMDFYFTAFSFDFEAMCRKLDGKDVGGNRL